MWPAYWFTCADVVPWNDKLGWDYFQTLEEGIRLTYEWISTQL